jgi:hypothetical protein
MRRPLYRQRKPVPVPDRLDGLIFLLRGQKVMFDSDLAALYGVTTKALNQAVKRNAGRFPDDFMFQLSEEEGELLRSQFVTLNLGPGHKSAKTGRKTQQTDGSLRSQIVTSNVGRGGRRHLPFAFTEQGVAMLSSVLRSARAVKVNIEIMRTFVRLRQLLAANADLERRLGELEKKYDRNFKAVFDAIRELMERPEPTRPDHGREIGFHTTPRLREEPPAYRCFTPRSRRLTAACLMS